MRVTVTKPEQELICRMLRFANLKKITSTDQVENLFRRIPLLTGEIQTLPVGEHFKYESDRGHLRDTLERIASGKIEERQEAIRRARKMLQHVLAGVALTEEGSLVFARGLLGIQACCWYGVGLILDPSRGLRDRLGLCDAAGCSRFNLSFEGRPRRYCNEKHRRAADASKVAERVRRWRKRKQGWGS